MSDTQQRIDELVKSNEVLLFMKGSASFPQCGFSGRAIEILKACGVDPKTLVFLLGELPYLTGLYERGRSELTPDDNLSVDGVKEMVLQARDRLKETLPKVAKRVTPQLLSVYFRYVRNLALLDRRLTPDLYALVVAAQQTAGDDFALAIAETARAYPHAHESDDEPLQLRISIDRADVPI